MSSSTLVSTDSVPTDPRQDFEVQHDQVVRTEIETFRKRARSFLAGEITEDEFRPFRLKHGIYGQRQAGVQMVRCKIPSGLLTASQVQQLARIADEFAGGKGHLTTRQNIQYHFVPLERVADLMHLMADAGMTNREACYNTVRNITTCAWAGIAADEVFDPRPYAQRLAYALMRKDLTGNLPRKFKIAFDGCQSRDCIAGATNDVGLRALERDGRRGFRVLIGGGLGALPREAHLLDEFLPEERLLNRVEAVIRVFNRYGNRENRNLARLKFLVRDRGFAWLQEEIDRQYADVLANGGIAWPEMVPEGFGGFRSEPREEHPVALPILEHPPAAGTNQAEAYDEWLETNAIEQRQQGYAAVTVRVDQGNLTGNQLRAVARIASHSGDGTVRVGIDQNLVLAFVPLANLPRVYRELEAAGLGRAGARQIDDVVTCPGAYSCNLALTKAMTMGAALSRAVADYRDPRVRQLAIKVSGCPNSCGQHWIADFGFYGNARKIGGREVPYYLMLLGGGFDEQGVMRFGLAVQSIPARLAPEAVRRVLDHFIANREAAETFRQYVLRHKVETFRQMTADLAKPAELSPEIYQDWGDEQAFSLELGRGECAA
ncbi:MAG: nitrite/sulfite reductase [Bryobacteraceae bacterium]|jgi:sulfite reductase beta subunit-like hemoprotein